MFALAVRSARLLAVILLAGLLTGIGSAQETSPEAVALASTFTYQGYLEQNAVPVTGNCDFQFSLFDAPAAGAQVGSTLTRTNVAVSGGIFNVQLDFGATAFDGQDRYLATSARCPAGAGGFIALNPRQPVTPAPYSIFATRAPWAGLQGVPAGFADGVDNTGADWSLTGNAGTTPGTNFIGTTDNQPLEIRVNNGRVMRYIPTGNTPSIIGGFDGNSVTAGVFGATISGGGNSFIGPNRVTDDFGTIGGGFNNRVGNGDGVTTNATHGTVGGGRDNTAIGNFSTVSGGSDNTASAESTVGGGVNNTAGGLGATVSGGENNTASGINAMVGGGADNTASGEGSAVSGGGGNTASGINAMVGGGADNTASGNFSFAAGRNANANDNGAFVWADSSINVFNSLGVNTFNVRASGGTFIISNASGNTGVFLSPGSGTWASLSDQTLKENLAAVDVLAVLDALVSIPVSTWNYISQDDAIRHMGVMAQDFYAAFGVGEDERHITTIDADGVAFAAIQGLNAKLESENAALRQQNADQQVQIDSMEARLAALEGLAGVGAQHAVPLPFVVIAGLGLLGVALRRATLVRK
jgi:hypothetical protein